MENIRLTWNKMQDQDATLQCLINAANSLVPFIKCMGLPRVVIDDILKNIRIVETFLPETSETLLETLKRDPYTFKEGTLVEHMRWLLYSLLFALETLRYIRKNSATFSEAIELAYNKTLAHQHEMYMRMIFKVALPLCPTYEKFYSNMNMNCAACKQWIQENQKSISNNVNTILYLLLFKKYPDIIISLNDTLLKTV